MFVKEFLSFFLRSLPKNGSGDFLFCFFVSVQLYRHLNHWYDEWSVVCAACGNDVFAFCDIVRVV